MYNHIFKPCRPSPLGRTHREEDADHSNHGVTISCTINVSDTWLFDDETKTKRLTIYIGREISLLNEQDG